MRLTHLAAAAAAVLLVPAADAGAVTVARGVDDFSTAIAADGTGLIAYKTGGTNGNVLGFCRLPYRGGACQTSIPPVPAVLPVDGTEDNASTVDGLELLRRPSDGVLILLTTTFDVDAPGDVGDRQSFVTTSADAGTTWSPQVQVGIGQGPAADASLTPDGTAINLIDEGPAAARFSRLPVAGPAVAPSLVLTPDPEDTSLEETLATAPDGSVVAGFEIGTNRFGLRRLPAGADPAQGWTPFQRVRTGDSSGYRLAAGPRGTFLFSTRPLIDQVRAGYRAPLERRRVTTTGVDGPVRLGSGSTNVTGAFAVDAIGGQHVAYWNRTTRRGITYLRTRGRRGRCSFGAATRQQRQGYARDLTVDAAAATPKRAVTTFVANARLGAVFARGGDRPKPRPRQGC